jgi:DNA repair protein RecO (recombination protein O)
MQAASTPALLLRSVDRGEDDRWVTLLSPQRGRVQALARHARGSKRRFGGALQAFVLIDATLRQRSGGSPFLEAVQALEHPLGPHASLEQLSAGWLFLELADQLCHQGQPQPAFFELLLGGLRRVGKGAEPLAAVRLSVLWGALSLEGWAPALDACARCQAPAPWPELALDPQAGGCLCPACLGPLNGPPLPGEALLQWQAAAAGRPLNGVLPSAEQALLAWIEHQIGHPLRSVRCDPTHPGA